MSSTRWRSGLGSVLIVIAAALIAFGAVYYRQSIIDTVHALQYQPTSSMATIRDKLDLTAKGKALFDASRPEIENAASFNQSCEQQKETNNPVLGCYVDQQVFVYHVTNTKLAGIEETTAAHELLHAAYDRLNATEKTSLDKDIKAAYEKVKTPALEKRMEYYKKSEPGQELNELHSILGTEFTNLGSTLESHYAQYFKDRKKILVYFTDYNSVFTSASNQLKTLRTDINTQTKAVNADIESYNSAAAQLKKDADAFNQKAETRGGFATQAQFNAARSDIINRQSKLANMRESIIAAIHRIDEKRDTYNKLAKEYNALNKSINSSLAPAPNFK